MPIGRSDRFRRTTRATSIDRFGVGGVDRLARLATMSAGAAVAFSGLLATLALSAAWLGCASTGGGRPGSGQSDLAEHEVLFFPQSEFPALPAVAPEVLLLGDAELPAVAGRLDFVDWGSTQTPDSDDVDWPSPVTRGGRTLIEIGVGISPTWILVNVFHAIDRDNGLPTDPVSGVLTELPEFRFECGGPAGASECPETSGANISIDALPGTQASDEYVVVFAAWRGRLGSDAQEETAGGPIASVIDVSASWLFRFANG